MSRTLSKQKNYRKSCTIINQRTQKKKGCTIETSSFVKSSIWVNKSQITMVRYELANISGGQSCNFGNYLERDLGVQVGVQIGGYGRGSGEHKYLRIANPQHIRINRARIFDWLLDVCRAFQLRWQTYWCTIQLIDFLVFIVDSVKVSNILMTAVTCLFMASKLHENNPPLLRRIIQKAVYNCFSEHQVLNLQAIILLHTANSPTKPKYLQTAYTVLYELFPRLDRKQRNEAIRRLILIWMDPVIAFDYTNTSRNRGKLDRDANQRGKNKSKMDTFVSYQDIVVMVVKGVEDNVENCCFGDVRKYFQGKYQCENLDVDWPGFEKIRL